MNEEKRGGNICPLCGSQLCIDDEIVRCLRCTFNIEAKRWDDRLLKTFQQLKQDWL